MAEPVTIGGQTFIKTAEGWVDQKSKAKAPEGLLSLLNRLQVENSPEGKKKRVRIDTSRPIVKLGKTEYVWDLNSNVWIDKKTKDAANPAFSKLIEAAYQSIVEGTTGTTEEEKLYENWAKKAAAGQVFSGMGVAGQAAKQKVKTPTGGGQLPVSNIKINSPIVQMIEKLATVDGYLKQRLDNQKKIANKNLVATKEAAIEAKSEDASPVEQNSQADAEKSDATGMGVALLVGGLIAAQFEPVQEAFKSLASGIKSVFNFVGNVANTISDGLDFFTGGSSSSSQSTAVDTSVQPNITQGNTPSSPNVAAPSLPAAPSEPTETTPSSTASSSSSTPAAMPNSGSNKAAATTTGRSVATRTNTSSGTTSNSGSRSSVPSPIRSNTAPPPAPSASPRVTPPTAPAPSTPASPNATPVTGTPPPQTGAPIDLQKYSYKDPSHVKGFNPDFASKLGPFLAAAEQAGVPIRITSGFRPYERQKQLFAEAVKKYGSEEAARKWVAPPGKSNHGRGVAADLDIAKPSAAQTWAHANAARFGLQFPMSWEPWHIEIPGASRYSGGSEPGILDQVIATGVNLTKGAMEALGTIARASFGKQEYVSGSQLLGFNDTMSGNIAKAAREKTTAMVDLKTPENAAASIPAPISLSTSPSSSSSGIQGAQTESDNSNIDWYLIRMGLIAKVNYEQTAHG
jgi:LAS superfamily LD-carboxypeptidase LdcB